MLALDTNVLVRLLTNDDVQAAAKVQHTLDTEFAQGKDCFVPQIVMCELVWVLRRLYGYELAQCQTALKALLSFPNFKIEDASVAHAAFKAWKKHGGDYADHLLGARALALGCEAVLTLDKKAAKASTHRLL
jgi:predicted nucleic-acid-binding protein